VQVTSRIRAAVAETRELKEQRRISV